MINEGIYTNLSSEEYHCDKSSFSRSSIMDFMKTPYFYWAKHLNPNKPPKEDTTAIALGKAFHDFVLEPLEFGRKYTLEPEKVLLKDVGREKYEAYKAKMKELGLMQQIILSQDEMTKLFNMRFSLQNISQAVELLSNGEIEKSFFWRDKQSGLMLKSRPDILHKNMYVDLKTCNDASPVAYQREMVLYGYHIQGAMLRDAIRHFENRDMSNVINVCVETKYPYTVAIYLIDEAALNYAEELYKSKLLDLKECIEKNEWPSYEIQTVGMPKWAI